MDYKLKCEVIKLLEKNFEKIFKNGVEFLDLTQNAQNLKGRTDILGLNKIKNICSEYPMKGMKKQTTD